jgi:hypothetical protein
MPAHELSSDFAEVSVNKKINSLAALTKVRQRKPDVIFLQGKKKENFANFLSRKS